MNKIYILIVSISCTMFSCSGTPEELAVLSTEIDTPSAQSISLSGAHIITQGMNLDEINTVIESASYGDTVWVESGTYVINGNLLLKPGISLMKSSSQNPIFDARWSTSELYRQTYYAANIDSCTFSGITFWNITFYVHDARDVAFKWCIFDYGVKKSGTNKSTDLHDAYIRLMNTENALVSNCVFSKRSGNSGRGVWNGSGSTGTKIMNNEFGNGNTTGHFITAINDNSESNSLISGNTIQRTESLNAEDDNTDHGIYAHSFNGLTIQNNVIKGWPPNASGGAIKARNGQNLTISKNVFHDSGILLYIYIEPSSYQYLKNVEVKNNEIHLDSLVGGMYGGTGYWRQANVTGIEESIRISDNTLPNGSIAISASNGFSASSFNASGGGVFNNDLHLPFLSLAIGVNQSGNY